MKRPKPYTAPANWRDPALPCIRDYRMADGTRRTEIDPTYERRYRAMLMETSAHPDWRQDPTYDMDRRKK